MARGHPRELLLRHAEVRGPRRPHDVDRSRGPAGPRPGPEAAPPWAPADGPAGARSRRAFEVRGFRPEGTFEETYELLKKIGADLGRSRIYAKALRGLWDYEETPAQVEATGLRMVRRELPRFREIVAAFARDLGCEPQAEAVENKLKEVRGLRKDQILPNILGLREVAEKVAHKHLIDINPKYSTLVVETPPYLANLIPSGAAYSLDSLTDRSRG